MQRMYFKNPLKYKRAWAQETLVVFFRFFFSGQGLLYSKTKII